MSGKRKIAIILLMTFLILPIGEIHTVAEKNEPLAKVNGKDFYGSLRHIKEREEIVDEIIYIQKDKMIFSNTTKYRQ